MSSSALEALIWVLIYGGILALCLGFFMLRQGGDFGTWLLGGGTISAVLGVLLIGVRAGRDDQR